MNERDGFVLTESYLVFQATKNEGRTFVVQTSSGATEFEWRAIECSTSNA